MHRYRTHELRTLVEIFEQQSSPSVLFSRFYTLVKNCLADIPNTADDSTMVSDWLDMQARKFYTLQVPFHWLVFMAPIEEMPPLINNPSGIVRSVAIWRLRLGR